MAINGPLNGVTVVELGNQVAAATCTRMMADLGANIIKSQYEADTAEIQAWLDDPETAQRVAAVDAMQAKIDKVNNFKGGIEKAKAIFDSQPVFTTQVLADIESNFKGTTAEILSYSFEEGAVMLNCKADKNTDPSVVIANFIEQDIFDNVTYTGFKNAKDENGTDSYEFMVTFAVRTPEPETEEKGAE